HFLLSNNMKGPPHKSVDSSFSAFSLPSLLFSFRYLLPSKETVGSDLIQKPCLRPPCGLFPRRLQQDRQGLAPPGRRILPRSPQSFPAFSALQFQSPPSGFACHISYAFSPVFISLYQNNLSGILRAVSAGLLHSFMELF